MADIETMAAKRKTDGAEVVINVSDFNEQEYERVKEPPAAAKSGSAPFAPVTPAVSHFSRDELAVFSLDKLKTLPEWNLIDGKGSKGELVEKLLQARATILARGK